MFCMNRKKCLKTGATHKGGEGVGGRVQHTMKERGLGTGVRIEDIGVAVHWRGTPSDLTGNALCQLSADTNCNG